MYVCMYVAYIGPNSRTERHRKTKIGTEVADVTHDSDTTFKVKRSRPRSPGRFGWLFKSLHNVCRRDQFLRHRPERAGACPSWIFMAQGALVDAGVRAMDWMWAAACVQRAGRGHIVSPRAQLVSLMNWRRCNWKTAKHKTSC